MIQREAYWNPKVIRYFPPSIPYPTDCRCNHCHEVAPLIFTHSMTCYPDDHGAWLCRVCSQQYCDYWQEMWDEYNASRG